MKTEIKDYRQLGKPIHESLAKTRLDDFLGKYFLFMSRTQWKKAIADSKVLVNEQARKGSYKLRTCDQIHYYSPETEEPTVNKNIRELWEKNGVLAMYKPSNLPIHEGGAYKNNTFCKVLQETKGKEWAPVHRLDRETSGIVLCANTTELRNHLSESLRTHTMKKTYLAIAIGNKKESSWTVDEPIGLSTESLLRTKQAVCKDGYKSLTDFNVLQTKDNFCFLEVRPKTGRTHQIRVHAAWSGLPLVGDKKYCSDETITLEYFEKGFTPKVESVTYFNRLCLHATKLEFMHPVDQKFYTICSPCPEDMLNIWDQLSNK